MLKRRRFYSSEKRKNQQNFRRTQLKHSKTKAIWEKSEQITWAESSVVYSKNAKGQRIIPWTNQT